MSDEKPWVKSYCGGKPNYCTPEVTHEVTHEVTGEAFVLDRGCWERGCVAYDERDGDGVTISAEPKREWVGLTDDEAWSCWNWEDFQSTWKSMEAKLKEKNT